MPATPAHPARAVSPPHPLPDRIRAFVAAPRFASIATTNADGTPHQAIAWYRLEEDGSLLVNSRDGRRWPANLRRDGRVSLAIPDLTNPTRWVGLSGVVASIDDDAERARDDIVALAHRYHDVPDPADLATYRAQRRVTFRIRITGFHDHLED